MFKKFNITFNKALKRTLSIIIFFSAFISNKPGYAADSGYLNPEVFITTDSSLLIMDILKPDFQKQFLYYTKQRPIVPGKFYWYKLNFENIDLTESDEWLLRLLDYSEVNFFFLNNDSIHQIKSKKKQDKLLKSKRFADFTFNQENLINGRNLYVRIANDTRSRSFGFIAYLTPQKAQSPATMSKEFFAQQIIYILFIGGIMLIIAYFIGIYFMYKDKLYIFYVLYLLSLLLYLGSKAEFIESNLIHFFSFPYHVFHELIQVLINIFYLLFASHFLNTRQDFPKLHKGIIYMISMLVLIMFIQLILIYNDNLFYLQKIVLNYERYFVMLFSLWAYYQIIRYFKDRMVFFIVIGSFIYLLGGLSALLFKEVAYMMAGAFIEVFIFSLGVGYRMKKIEQEKKLIENEIIQTELTALKAQMNPHFIFNSLNCIRAYVISNDIKKASLYITKFSKLIRLILYYSEKEFITLKEEIDSLQLYVELEELRFRESFGLKIIINDNLDTSLLLLPPMILQPYVENAIRHGLAAKEGEKQILVTVGAINNKLQIRINDNGVGRDFNKKKDKPEDHKPMAMDLTKRRIQLTEKTYSSEENVIINDLKKNNIASGTEVIIKLPLIRKK